MPSSTFGYSSLNESSALARNVGSSCAIAGNLPRSELLLPFLGCRFMVFGWWLAVAELIIAVDLLRSKFAIWECGITWCCCCCCCWFCCWCFMKLIWSNVLNMGWFACSWATDVDVVINGGSRDGFICDVEFVIIWLEAALEVGETWECWFTDGDWRQVWGR